MPKRKPRTVVHLSGKRAKLRWPRQATPDGFRSAGGWYDPVTHNISISTASPKADQAEYLVHELLHGVRPALAHKVIYWLSERIVLWIRANPDLARWIVDAALTGKYKPRKEHHHVDFPEANGVPPVV